VATQHVGAIQLPDTLGRRVKMADAKIALRDHHGLFARSSAASRKSGVSTTAVSCARIVQS
jgi:hypothetical protein